ncbi:MAG: hypothetical protein JNK05_41825 [Myxococcales bacterium]|nr:hypothetical protein [Myxococcales bacterium]
MTEAKMREGLPPDGISIERRCSQKWGDRDERYFHCAQCDEEVLDLSSFTYREYVQWIADRPNRGKQCVRALVDSDRRIVLREEPAPRRRLPIVSAAAVAATLATAPGCEKRAPDAPTVVAANERQSAPREADASVAASTQTATSDAAITSAISPVHEADSGVASGEREHSPDTEHVTDAGRIVRVRHPHPPGRHLRRPIGRVDELVGLDAL